MPLRIKDVSLYTVRDVAYRLGIAEGTVRKYLRDGKMVGRKHAGAWHVSEESFRAFLQQTGDDLRPEDVPQIVIQVPIQHDEEDETLTATNDSPRRRPEGMDEITWLILEAKRLKREARRLERRYIDPNLPEA